MTPPAHMGPPAPSSPKPRLEVLAHNVVQVKQLGKDPDRGPSINRLGIGDHPVNIKYQPV